MNGNKAIEYLAVRIANLEKEKAILIAQVESLSQKLLEKGGAEGEKV